MPPSQNKTPETRQRAKRACETCKLRKRRCNGEEPCSFCVRYQYHCIYNPRTRKRAIPGLGSPRGQSKQHDGSRFQDTNASNQNQMEANSGMAFPRVLQMKLDPEEAPRINHVNVSWSVGLRPRFTQQTTDLKGLISQADMKSLAEVYHQKLHPVLAFLPWAQVQEAIRSKWQDENDTGNYDAILCGVAALGSLFSGSTEYVREGELVQCAQDILHGANGEKPRLHHAAAWLLRTIYVRSNDSPHASWMASCNTMHILEAIGAHQDSGQTSLVYSDTLDNNESPESRRKLFWIATALNAWISYEYGRSRVTIPDISCKMPAHQQHEFTTDLIQLYRISELLDPNQEETSTDFEECITQLERLEFAHDAVILSQSNLALTIYRRLRLASSKISGTTLNSIMKLGNHGLQAAYRLAEGRCPWWHVANVPFQYICVLLAIDSGESLSQIAHVRRTYEAIALQFPTQSLRKAVETAESLISLSQRKKERDIAFLRSDHTDENLDMGATASIGDEAMAAFDWSMQGGEEWDWNDPFWSTENPLFNIFK